MPDGDEGWEELMSGDTRCYRCGAWWYVATSPGLCPHCGQKYDREHQHRTETR